MDINQTTETLRTWRGHLIVFLYDRKLIAIGNICCLEVYEAFYKNFPDSALNWGTVTVALLQILLCIEDVLGSNLGSQALQGFGCATVLPVASGDN